MKLSREEKKALLQAYNEKQNKKYLLSKRDVKSLFGYLSKKLSTDECDHTLQHTNAWLAKKIEDENTRQQVLNEIQKDGGYCDCEVLLNCYERYDLEY